MTQESAFFYSPVLLTLGNLFAVLLVGARVGTGGMSFIMERKRGQRLADWNPASTDP